MSRQKSFPLFYHSAINTPKGNCSGYGCKVSVSLAVSVSVLSLSSCYSCAKNHKRSIPRTTSLCPAVSLNERKECAVNTQPKKQAIKIVCFASCQRKSSEEESGEKNWVKMQHSKMQREVQSRISIRLQCVPDSTGHSFIHLLIQEQTSAASSVVSQCVCLFVCLSRCFINGTL